MPVPFPSQNPTWLGLTSKSKADPTVLMDSGSIDSNTCVSNNYLHVNDLPASVLLQILQYLPMRDLLLSAGLVCRFWLSLAKDPTLWRFINLRREHKVDDEILIRLTSLSGNVVMLDISDTKLITADGFCKVARNCVTLRTLKLIR